MVVLVSSGFESCALSCCRLSAAATARREGSVSYHFNLGSGFIVIRLTRGFSCTVGRHGESVKESPTKRRRAHEERAGNGRNNVVAFGRGIIRVSCVEAKSI